METYISTYFYARIPNFWSKITKNRTFLPKKSIFRPKMTIFNPFQLILRGGAHDQIYGRKIRDGLYSNYTLFFTACWGRRENPELGNKHLCPTRIRWFWGAHISMRAFGCQSWAQKHATYHFTSISTIFPVSRDLKRSLFWQCLRPTAGPYQNKMVLRSSH